MGKLLKKKIPILIALIMLFTVFMGSGVIKQEQVKADNLPNQIEQPTTKDDYSKAIEETVKLRRPTLINAHVEIDEKVLPMVAPGHQIDDIMLK